MRSIRCPECGGRLRAKETRPEEDAILRRRDCMNKACPHLVDTGRYISVWSKEQVEFITDRVPKTNTRKQRRVTTNTRKKISKLSDKTEMELELSLPEFKVADGME